MAVSKGLETKIQTLIRKEAKAQTKKIKKQKYVHWVSLFRFLLSTETLSLLTIQYFDYIVTLRRKHNGLQVQHLFILQYLHKVTFASQPELRYMFRKTFGSVPKRIALDCLMNNHFIEKQKLKRKGKDKNGDPRERVVQFLVITKEGRQLVESLANKTVLKNMLGNYKEVNKKLNKIRQGQRKAFIERSPDLRLNDR